MKTSRVITLVLVAVTTLLCCFPVAALDVANSYSYSNVIDNNLTQYLNVSVMYADDESYAYGTDSDVVQYYDAPTYQALVNYRVKNTSDHDANLNVSYIALDFGLQASGYNVIGVEYVSGALEPYYVSISDFRLQQVDGTSTTVIVPAGGYISGTFIIHLQETYDNSSGTHIQYPAFSNFNTWDSFSPTYGNYNSTVLDYVSDVYVELLEQGESIDDIITILGLDPSLVDYNSPTISGTRNNIKYSWSYNYTVLANAYTYVGFPSIVSNSIDSNFTNNHYSLIYKVPVLYSYRVTNISSDTLISTSAGFSQFYGIAGNAPNFTYLGNQVDVVNSDFIFTGLSFNLGGTDTVICQDANPLDQYFNLGPDETKSYSVLVYYYFGTVSTDNPQFNFTITNNYINTPSTFTFSVYQTDVQDIVEDQHEQEQTYYSDTNTALQNSGLPDYNFNSQQTGGLSGVSDDFVRVWNACGALNSVFVFSLTLSLALYILRHRRRL